ncbi:MAG TPA: WcaF family extracellular polysaccharide biosynthesis acetyltransferase [Puia sp.]|nr:WcaF family extracellular polysaccharide biosynthesis acetyltransferase [Puia sp.]
MNTGVKKQVNNASYKTTIDIGASRFKQVAWYFTNILFFKNSLNIISSLKVSLLKLFGAQLGTGVVIKPAVNIKYPWKLQVGDHTWIGEQVWIDNLSNVTIGKNVNLSQGSLLLTGSHDHTRTSFDFMSYPIVLEDGVWIGAKAVVFGGTICRSHSILGMNSVAEKDLEAYTIYKGNPAIAVITRTIL